MFFQYHSTNSSQEAIDTKISITHQCQEEDANIDAMLLECISFAIPTV